MASARKDEWRNQAAHDEQEEMDGLGNTYSRCRVCPARCSMLGDSGAELDTYMPPCPETHDVTHKNPQKAITNICPPVSASHDPVGGRKQI